MENNNITNSSNLQLFGFTEMYEWVNNPDNLPNNGVGLFVQFNKVESDKIEPFTDSTDHVFCGITSSCAVITSDNPMEWHEKYISTETGQLLLKRHLIAVGNKEYDQGNELSFVRTFPYQIYKKEISNNFDSTKQYIPRENRIEWTRVNLMGKVIVMDDGTCKPGQFCTPIVFDKNDGDYTKAGFATKAQDNDKLKFYVLKRISDHSILILNKYI